MLLLRSKGYDLRVRVYRKKSDNTVYVLYFAASDVMSFSANSGTEGDVLPCL
jgi:hypothetical protein